METFLAFGIPNEPVQLTTLAVSSFAFLLVPMGIASPPAVSTRFQAVHSCIGEVGRTGLPAHWPDSVETLSARRVAEKTRFFQA